MSNADTFGLAVGPWAALRSAALIGCPEAQLESISGACNWNADSQSPEPARGIGCPLLAPERRFANAFLSQVQLALG